MKYVLFSLSEASKLDFTGAAGLSGSDHLVCVYVKGKKTLSASLKETLDEVKASVDYVEIGAASELWLMVSYLIGFHAASKHEVIVVTADKSKIPSRIAKDAKILSSFKTLGSGTAKASTKTTAKKTTSAKTSSAKKTTAKSSTAKKASTTKKTTTAKKSSTAKKTTAKTTAKKTAAKKKKESVDVGDLITSFTKGDTKDLSKKLTNLTNQILKGKK
ncbi:MAG: hypothetical protein J5379_00060 [Clostridiales bacterium]|nr:hypothetical protein [Clostridiales bacterium]